MAGERLVLNKPAFDKTNARSAVNVPVLIPAYNPQGTLLDVADGLIRLGFQNIVVVDDGSAPSSEHVFRRIESLPQCEVLRHAVNLGKGAALKTGFNFIILNYPHAESIITADADGQHSPEDISSVAQAAMASPGTIVLGARSFGRDVPLRSFFGNHVTKLVMRFFTGLKLSDTQTGLRAWPRILCAEALKISTNGYDFEMEGLILAKQSLGAERTMLEVPIRTIYEEGNRSSHFNPLIDSMRIYFVFIRYSGAAITASLIDYVLFMTFYTALRNILLSLIMARSLAVIAAYLMAKNVVFKDSRPNKETILLYIVVAVGYLLISYGSIHYLTSVVGMNVLIAKLMTEGVMFFASFTIQRDFIFKGRQGK